MVLIQHIVQNTDQRSSNFNSDKYLLSLHCVHGTIPGAAITIFPFQEK